MEKNKIVSFEGKMSGTVDHRAKETKPESERVAMFSLYVGYGGKKGEGNRGRKKGKRQNMDAF